MQLSAEKQPFPLLFSEIWNNIVAQSALFCYFCRRASALPLKYIIMENQDKNNGQLKIELTPEVAEGIYSNLAIITHSSAEVVLDFIRVLPGLPKANVKSRIVLAPEHAKRLLYALQDNIVKYEKAYGPIRLPETAEQPQGGRTATPFGVPEGNA